MMTTEIEGVPKTTRGLLPHHAEQLRKSGISDNVAKARGYFSATTRADMTSLGFKDYQARGLPALVIPVYDATGHIAFYQARPDAPRTTEAGKLIKYETPSGVRMALDVPRMIREKLGDPAVPLWISEGIKKADSAVTHGLTCIGLPGGVWGWRGRNGQGGKVALADWENVCLNTRRLFICFDSDVMVKWEVRDALSRLKEFLESRGAEVWVIYLPSGPNGEKIGLDDYFVAGGTVEELQKLATPELRPFDSGFRSNGSVADATDTQAGPEIIHLTDAGNAELFAKAHRGRLLYVDAWRAYMAYDGTRWKRDGKAEWFAGASEVNKELFRRAAVAPDDIRKACGQWAIHSEMKSQIVAMIELAKWKLTATPDKFDTDPAILNCTNGTIDLRTGERRDHNPKDYITKLVPHPFDPEVKCPRFERFISEIFDRTKDGKRNDKASMSLTAYIQRVLGHAATGETREQAWWLLWGPGGNGKTKLTEAVVYTLGGDYAGEAAPDLLLADRRDGHPTVIADLHGKRFIVASENEAGKHLAEALAKKLTGDRKLKGRFMKQDYFEFQNTSKLFLQTNHKPEISPEDDATWDRVRLLPFVVRFRGTEKEDKKLDEKLQAEASGILAWLVRGAVDWYANGLQDPEEVRAATRDYRDECDELKGFIAECCLTGPNYKEKSADLYKGYAEWLGRNGGGLPMSTTEFGRALEAKGFKKEKSGIMWRLGIAIRPDEPKPEGNQREPGEEG